MKKMFAVLICVLLLSGCNASAPSEPESTENSSTNTAESENQDKYDGITYAIERVEESIHGKNLLYDISFYNDGEYILDGVVEFLFRDENTEQIYTCGLPISNLVPGSYESGTFWMPYDIYDGKEQNFAVNEVRMEFLDDFNEYPNITSENIGSYVYTNYDIGEITSGDRPISAHIENCTMQYFSGEVTVKVYGKDGQILEEKSTSLKNLAPSHSEVVTLFVDGTNEPYTFETVFEENFSFSDTVSSDTSKGSSEAATGNYDEALSKLASDMMEGSFGGSGNPEYAASWYSYISSVSVFEENGKYYGKIELTDTPADSLLRAFTSSYDLGDVYDPFIEVLIDTQYGMGLDDVNTCLAAENIYKIYTTNGPVGIYYSSLYSAGLDAYQYISDATNGEYSRSYVMENADSMYGPDFAGAILSQLIYDYDGKCTRIMEADAHTIGMALKANFDEVELYKVELFNPQGTKVYTVE